MSGLLGEMAVGVSLDVSKVGAGANSASSTISGFAQNAMKVLGPVGTGLAVVGAAAIGLGVSSVNAASNFQASMLKVQAYAGLSKKQTDAMGDSILSMAAKLGQSPKAMADAIYPIISSGYSASQALDILQLSAKTAAASGADMSTVADMLTTSLKASGAPASDAGKYMDMFTKIVASGKGEVSDYSKVIGKLSLAAGSAHVPFSDMGGALATLTTHGFPSVSQASNALGNMFTQIGPKVDSLAQHAKKLGLNFNESSFKSMDLSGKLAYLKSVTGGNEGEMLKMMGGSTLALKAFDALSGSSKDLTSAISNVRNSAGATDSAYKTASSGFAASMNRMKAAGEVLQVKIGQALLPALTKITDAVSPIITSFADWVTKSNVIPNAINGITTVVQKVVPVIVALATGVGNVINWFRNASGPGEAVRGLLVGIGVAFAAIQIGAFIATIPALVGGFIAWATTAGAAALATIAATLPLLLIGAAIAIAVGIIILAVTHWGAIMDWITGKTEQTRINVALKHSQMAENADKKTSEQATKVINNIEKERAGVIAKLGQTHDTTERMRLQHELNNLNIQANAEMQRKRLADDNAKKEVEKQKKLHADLEEAQKNFAQRFLDMVGHWIGDQMSKLGSMVSGWVKVMGQIKDNVINKVMVLKQDFLVHVELLRYGILAKFLEIKQKVITTVSDAWNNVINTFTNAKNNVMNTVQNLWNGINNFFGGLPQKMLDFGVSMIQGLINGIESMAGNIAGAIGGLFSGLGSSVHNALHGAGIPGFANGISNFGGGFAIVGEKGPELVKLPGGSSVYPNGKGPTGGRSSGSSGGSGNGDMQHITIELDGHVLTEAVMSRAARNVRIRQGRRIA